MKKGWRRVRLDELGEVVGGKQKVHATAPGRPQKYLRVANVLDGSIDFSDVLEMPFTDEEFARFSLREGDVLLNEGQSLELVGRAARYCGLPGQFAFQNSLIRFRSGPKCDPVFAEAMLRHLQRAGVFRGIASRTTSIAHLGVTRLAALKVVVPPLEVQQRVGAIAQRFEAAEYAGGRLLAAKRRLKRALMQRLCLEPPTRTAPARIADVAEETSERVVGRQVPILSCTKHDGLVDSLKYFGRRVFSEDTSGYRLVRRGQLAYATNHIEEGSIGLLQDLDEGAVSPMYTVFRCRTGIDPEYLYAMLKTERYRVQFAALTSGSVNRRGGLRWDVFSKITLRLPPFEWQMRASHALRLAETECNAAERLLAALRLQKRGVMQKLLSGELQ